jgi:asparagine synthase (glutamine-hydrolysing)
MTKQYVTVALNGDGSDECFAGYPRYVGAKNAYYLQKITALSIRTVAANLIKMLPEGQYRNSFLSRLKRYVDAFCETPERRYVRWLCHFDNNLKDEICSPSFKEIVKGIDSVDLIEELFKKADGKSFIDRTLYVDVMSYLPEDLLVKIDIASMAHSLEARSPFVDHKVMEFAASLPIDLKLRRSETKSILKRTLSDLLPKSIRYRRKMGFGVPIDRWLKVELKDMIYDVLLDKTSTERGYFRKEAIKRLLDEHITGKSNQCYRIWNLLCLELWYRMYIDKTISLSN